MSKAKKTAGKSGASNDGDLGFEAAMDELESLINQIESGEIGLEESIAAYERGIGLVGRCRGMLTSAEQRIEALTASLEDETPGDPSQLDG